jgi:hypothetical protein
LTRAFSLLERRDVPVLEEYPLSIDDDTEHAATCPLPPRFDAAAHPAVDEVRGLRAAYDRQLARTGRTLVGRVGNADDIAGIVERFVRIAEGAGLDAVGFSGLSAIAASQDIRAYYEEAALALLDHVPAARQTESWFFQSTATGKVVVAARDALKASGANQQVTGYLTPISQ